MQKTTQSINSQTQNKSRISQNESEDNKQTKTQLPTKMSQQQQHRKETIKLPTDSTDFNNFEAPPKETINEELAQKKMKNIAKPNKKSPKTEGNKTDLKIKSKSCNSRKSMRGTCTKKTAVEKCNEELDRMFLKLKDEMMPKLLKWAEAILQNKENQFQLTEMSDRIFTFSGKFKEGISEKETIKVMKDIHKVKGLMKNAPQIQKRSLRTIKVLQKLNKLNKFTEPKKQAVALYEIFVLHPLTKTDDAYKSKLDAYNTEFRHLFSDFIPFIETYHELKKLASEPKKANKLFAKLSEPEVVHTIFHLSYNEIDQSDVVEKFFKWTMIATDKKSNDAFFPAMKKTLICEPLFYFEVDRRRR